MPGPLPRFDMPDDMRHVAGGGGRGPTLIAALVTLVVLAIAAVAVLVLRNDGSRSGTPAEPAAAFDGTIYVESNQRGGANSVLAFRYKGGSLRPLSVTEYPTGGSGVHDLSNSGLLDIEGSIATSTDRKLLFAVNAGSDTIAVFRVGANGTLTPVKGSPFPSQGKGPASVDYRDGHLYVANKAHDNDRDLTGVPASYASFEVAADGTLSPVGSPQLVPPGSSPTQAFVTPDGKLLLGTDEQGATPFSPGPFNSFRIGPDGALTKVVGSPFELDPTVLEGKQPRMLAWAQGLVARPHERLVYAGVANLKKLVVHEYDPASGRVTFVRSVENKGAVLPCWTEMSPDGRFLYTGNAGNNTMSVFDIATDPRNPRQIQTFKLKGGGNPWNFTLDPTGRFIFLVDMRAADFIRRGDGNELHTLAIGPDGRLSEPDYSPVPIPVPTDTNPWGIAVVPH
jgi:6-phosphogluconolactonase (cycloisomerase 2 family)